MEASCLVESITKNTPHFRVPLHCKTKSSYLFRDIFKANTLNRIWNKHWYCLKKNLSWFITKSSKYLKHIPSLGKVPPTRAHLHVPGRRGESMPGISYYQCGLLMDRWFSSVLTVSCPVLPVAPSDRLWRRVEPLFSSFMMYWELKSWLPRMSSSMRL